MFAIARAADRMWPSMMRTVLNEVMQAVPEDLRQEGVSLDGEAAGHALDRIRRAIEELAVQEAQSHDPYAWLFYLRRLPDELFQGRPGDHGAVRSDAFRHFVGCE